MYFAQCSFTELESTFVKLLNESSLKVIGQELLIVNNSDYSKKKLQLQQNMFKNVWSREAAKKVF